MGVAQLHSSMHGSCSNAFQRAGSSSSSSASRARMHCGARSFSTEEEEEEEGNEEEGNEEVEEEEGEGRQIQDGVTRFPVGDHYDKFYRNSLFFKFSRGSRI